MWKTITYMSQGAFAVWLVLAMLALMVSGSFAAGLTIVKVKDNIEVNNNKILLGKISIIETADQALRRQLEQCVVGRAPLPGHSRQIKGDYLNVKLKQAGIDPARIVLQAPDSITVTRQSVTISTQELEKIARAFIRANVPHDRDRMKIEEIQTRSEVKLPTGNITYNVTVPPRTDFVGNVPLAITFLCNGTQIKKVWVMAKLKVLCDVVLARKPLGRYQVIGADDVEVQSMDLTEVSHDVITSLEEVIGQRAKRTIDARTVLNSGMIESPPLVQRGDIVVMIAESGGLKISTQGEARQKGAKGDRIKVMNLDSRKSVFARVVDRNMVRVDF